MDHSVVQSVRKPDIGRGASRLRFWRMDPRVSIVGHIFRLHSAYCWGIEFPEVRRVVKVILDQSDETHIGAKAIPVIERDHFGS